MCVFIYTTQGLGILWDEDTSDSARDHGWNSKHRFWNFTNPMMLVLLVTQLTCQNFGRGSFAVLVAVNSGTVFICGRLLITGECHLACMERLRQDSTLSLSELHSLSQPSHTPGWSTEQTSWTQSGNRKLEGIFTLKKEFSLFLLGCFPPPPLPFCCYKPFEASTL